MMKHLKRLFDALVTLVMLCAAGLVIWQGVAGPISSRRTQSVPLPAASIDIDNAPAIGRNDATVVVVEFSDFQCPYCSRFVQEVFPSMKEKYVDTGRIKFVFRHLPLPIHPMAERLAKAAECAREQNKFWPFHDALFATPLEAGTGTISEIEKSLGLDPVAFSDCQANDSVGVQIGLRQAKAFQITGTPTFLIGKKDDKGGVKVRTLLKGARSLDELSSAIDMVSR